MTTLFLDFASHHKSIALLKGDRTVSIVPIDDHAKEAELLPAIETMLRSAGEDMRSLNRIAATTGPGGFMSLRVGLSLANTLAWSLKVPVGGIHLSDLWHARAPEDMNVLWLHSTKKDALFVRGLGSRAKDFPEATLVKFDEFSIGLTDAADFIGELIPEHAKTLTVTMAEPLKTLENVLPEAVNHVSYGNPPLLPWYGRGI